MVTKRKGYRACSENKFMEQRLVYTNPELATLNSVREYGNRVRLAEF